MIKIIIVIAISLWLFIKLFNPLLYPMSTFWSSEGVRSRYISALIKEKLHIPHQSYKRPDKPFEYKQGWQDLEPIRYDEWFSIKCEHPKNKYGSYYTSYFAELYLNKEQQKQVHCIEPKSWANQTKHCTSIFNCPSIQINFYDYILNYPKVLDNVIKIMEKPCDYLSDDFGFAVRSGYKPTDEEWAKLVEENKTDAYIEVKNMRNLLYCDKPKDYSYQKDRTYSVIYIFDKNGNRKTEIIVPRKDNAHLVKNKK